MRGSVWKMGNNGDECLFSLILIKYISRVGHVFVLSWTRRCNDYGGVYVFHVRFDLCVIHGVGLCDDVHGLVCVVEWGLFLEPMSVNY